MCIRFLSEPSLYWQSIWSSSKKWCWNGFAILPAVLVPCVGNSVCISAQHGYHFANFWFTACIPALYVLQESTWRTNITIIIHHFIRNFNTIGVPLKGLEISAQGDAYRLTRLFFYYYFYFYPAKKLFNLTCTRMRVLAWSLNWSAWLWISCVLKALGFTRSQLVSVCHWSEHQHNTCLEMYGNRWPVVVCHQFSHIISVVALPELEAIPVAVLSFELTDQNT